MKLTQTSLRWVAGLFFLLGAIIEPSEGAYISGVSSFILALLLMPPTARFLFARIPRAIPKIMKVGIAIILFFIMISTSSSNTKKPAPSPTPTTNTEAQEITSEPSETLTPSPVATASVTESTSATQGDKATVTRVVDGDTFVVSLSGKTETVRVLGLDTPELLDPRKSVECFAENASNKAMEMLTGKSVWLTADSSQGDRDKYNRLLRYARIDGGVEDFGKSMIAEGFGHEYTYNKPYALQKEYQQAEQDAQSGKRGLWADDACPPSPSPTPKPSSTPKPAATPKSQSSSGTSQVAPAMTGGSWTCNCAKTCPNMSCAEAQYQLNTCGCSRRDGDDDGVACDTQCQ